MKRPPWESPLVAFPLGVFCLLVWWLVIATAWKLWPR